MKKFISACLLVFSLLLVNVVPAFAASHYGDAVYRDGVGVFGSNLTWHAAINNYSTVGMYVIQAPGGSGVVQYASWADFLGKDSNGNPNTYQGPPQYISGMTENDLNNIWNTASFLADRRNVSYTGIDMMHGTTSGTYISPGNVTQLRCDGLVEYCYEWYNWPVLFDKNANWDITNINSTQYHSSYYVNYWGTSFNPVTQWSHMNPHYD